MKFSNSLFLLVLISLFACKAEIKQEPVVLFKEGFKETPTQFSGNKEQAYQQLNASLELLVNNRTDQGKMKQDYNSTIIGHTLGIAQQFPQENESLQVSFRAAELLAASEDYENAAKLYKLITTTFPKGEKVGHATIQLGIILDKHLDNKPAAIQVYRTFLKEYLDHPFVGTAEGLLYELVRYNQTQ